MAPVTILLRINIRYFSTTLMSKIVEGGFQFNSHGVTGLSAIIDI